MSLSQTPKEKPFIQLVKRYILEKIFAFPPLFLVYRVQLCGRVWSPQKGREKKRGKKKRTDDNEASDTRTRGRSRSSFKRLFNSANRRYFKSAMLCFLFFPSPPDLSSYATMLTGAVGYNRMLDGGVWTWERDLSVWNEAVRLMKPWSRRRSINGTMEGKNEPPPPQNKKRRQK